uniref:Uncharacterized protein n=1 Tax=Ditylenchus dipsaci TaxID=166011 RepID=A0A915E5K1_9BILA
MSVWPDEHEFVPWLLFNNVSIKSQQSLQRQLPSAICQWYVGDKRPEACGSPMLGNTKLQAAMPPFSACLAN